MNTGPLRRLRIGVFRYCVAEEIVMKAWIKPVYCDNELVSFALCTSDDPLSDCDVIQHFDTDYTGREIRESAAEFHGMDECEWGSPINHDSPKAKVEKHWSGFPAHMVVTDGPVDGPYPYFS